MQNIEQLRKKIKEEPENCERELFQFVCRLAFKLAERISREMDDGLRRKRLWG